MIEVKSNFLSKQEIDFLKGMFISPTHKMYIDGEEYPIVRITDKQQIKSKEKIGLVMYKFIVEYAKIIK